MGCKARGRSSSGSEFLRVGAEGRDQLAEVGLVEHARGFGGRHPFALALALFLPLVGDLVDLERDRPAPRTAPPRRTTAPWHRNSGRPRWRETAPDRPASSPASRAAASYSSSPPSGQPLGRTQRPVSRLVISMISTPSSVLRHGKAATCRRQGALPNSRRTLSTRWLLVSCIHERQMGNVPSSDSFAALIIVRLIVENKSKNSISRFQVPASRKRRNRRGRPHGLIRTRFACPSVTGRVEEIVTER